MTAPSSGNAYSKMAGKRENKKRWVLTEFGDGETAPCEGCGTTLTMDTLTIDRWPMPGKWGGTYRRGNMRPMCERCNSSHVGEPGSESVAAPLTHRPFAALVGRAS